MTGLKKLLTKCGSCRKVVHEGSYALGCEYDGCDTWFHIECLGMGVAEHDRLVEVGEEWFCERCGLKNDKVLLNKELESLAQTIALLQSDLNSMQVSCDQLKSQNVSLGDICLKKEEEIVKLKSELESYLNSTVFKVKDRGVSRGYDASGFTSDFPPLSVSNRFSLLSLEDDDHKLQSDSPVIINKRTDTGYRNRGSARPNVNDGKSSKPIPNDCSHSTPNVPSLVRKDGLNNNVVRPTGPSSKVNNSYSNLKIRRPCKVFNYCATNRPIVNQDLSKPRLLILGDSHARDLASYLTVLNESNISIFSICKPSARLSEILVDFEKHIKDMTKDDFVLILGGSNDINFNSVSLFTGLVRNRLSCLKNNNNVPHVIFANLPARHDNPSLKNAIEKCNADLWTSDVTNGFKILDMSVLQRGLFTRHGQHLRKCGKLYLCKLILDLLKEILGNTVFLDQ